MRQEVRVAVKVRMRLTHVDCVDAETPRSYVNADGHERFHATKDLGISPTNKALVGMDDSEASYGCHETKLYAASEAVNFHMSDERGECVLADQALSS